MSRRAPIVALSGALILLAVAPPAPALEIHAHRGGPLENGRPVAPENSISAYRRAAERWRPEFIEADVKRTRDGIPVVIHDATLDRTTPCSGPVIERTLAELERCPLDRLGTDDVTEPIPDPSEAIPTLAEVLDWARAAGVRLHIEIKNPPTDSDFTTSTRESVDPVIELIAARGMLGQVAVQSFWPPDLDRAEQLSAARGVDLRTGLLTLRELNEGAIPFAGISGYEAVLPEWPPQGEAASFVGRAQGAGKLVVPYTLDSAEVMRGAIAAGVDGFFTNDLGAANEAAPREGAPFERPPAAPAARPRLRLSYRRGRVRVGRSTRSCARGAVRASLSGSGVTAIRRVTYRLAGPGSRVRRVGSTSRSPFRATVRRSLLVPRRLHRVRASVTRNDGSRATVSRQIRACSR